MPPLRTTAGIFPPLPDVPDLPPQPRAQGSDPGHRQGVLV